jgi:hypothetical protein
LSSTTNSRERGQILIIFAVALIVILGVGALVFDGGTMLLEKRTQQNAADASALGGARYLPIDTGVAEQAARDIATANGFTEGVDVNIPPTTGPNAGNSNFIEVIIDTERPSLFARIWGIASLDVASRAVAANQTGVRGPFALLSLDPEGCHALIVEGQGELISNGNIHVNSDCEEALRLAGQGEIVTAPHVSCNIAGGASIGGQANYNCEMSEGVQPIPDPFADLPEPSIPTSGDPPVITYPTPPLQEGGAAKGIPVGCPGSDDSATHEEPAICQFPGSYAGTTWRLYPGYYPGGIHLQAGDFYLEPGIYYVTGPEGVTIDGGGASVTSVATGGTTLGGGVLLFNGSNAAAANDGAISLKGGNAGVNLWPLDQGTQWDGIIIFQARDVCNDVTINGASSHMEVRGVIYVPCGTVVIEGNGGTITTDQIIAYRFHMKGNVGSLTVAYDEDFLPGHSVAGLVE